MVQSAVAKQRAVGKQEAKTRQQRQTPCCLHNSNLWDNDVIQRTNGTLLLPWRGLATQQRDGFGFVLLTPSRFC
jgi:hypothetical protein